MGSASRLKAGHTTTLRNKSALLPGSYKTSFDTSPPQKSVSLHYKQINRVKNKVDGHPSSLLDRTNVFDYKADFVPMHLVFLELDTYYCHLGFKLLNENNKAVILKTFYLKLLNKHLMKRVKFIKI